MGSQCSTSISNWRFQYGIIFNFLHRVIAYRYPSQDEWNRDATPMTRGEYGRWEVTLLAKDGQLAIPHGSKVKVSSTIWKRYATIADMWAQISLVIPTSHERLERVPAWITRVTQNLNFSPVYDGVFWHPPQNERYIFKHSRPPKPKSARIYEAHVGIS